MLLLALVLLVAPASAQESNGEPSEPGRSALASELKEAATEEPVAAAPEAVQVVLRRGRASLLPMRGDGQPGRLAMLSPRHPRLTVERGLHLELGASAEVWLGWIGRGSVRITGPALVCWREGGPVDPVDEAAQGKADALDPELGDPEATTRDRTVRLELVSFHRLEVEARDDPIVLHAAREAWTLDVRRGAARLERRPDGRLAVRHHGGAPISVWNLGRRAPGTWPSRIGAGRWVLLPASELGVSGAASRGLRTRP